MNKASCIKGVEVLTLFHFNEWTLKFPFSPHNTFHKFNEGATFKGGARNIEYCKQRKTSTMAHFPILVRERVNRNQCLVIINIFKAFSCEKRFKGGIWNGPKFGSQPKRVTYDVSVFTLQVWSQGVRDCWCKVVFEMSQNMVLIGQSTKTDHTCKMILGHSILTTTKHLSRNMCPKALLVCWCYSWSR
jgi:hypothetical protein